MKCSKCGNESDIIINTVFDGKMNALCDRCLSDMEPKFNDVLEIDKAIREGEEIIARFEKLLERAEEQDVSELPEPLASMAFTPSKAIRMAKNQMEILQKEKEELLCSMEEKNALVYKLNLAINNEEYGLAVSIKEKPEDIDP